MCVCVFVFIEIGFFFQFSVTTHIPASFKANKGCLVGKHVVISFCYYASLYVYNDRARGEYFKKEKTEVYNVSIEVFQQLHQFFDFLCLTQSVEK